jgi:hypothetical protein
MDWTLAIFPPDVTAAGMGRKEMVLAAGVRKHPVISDRREARGRIYRTRTRSPARS